MDCENCSHICNECIYSKLSHEAPDDGGTHDCWCMKYNIDISDYVYNDMYGFEWHSPDCCDSYMTEDDLPPRELEPQWSNMGITYDQI